MSLVYFDKQPYLVQSKDRNTSKVQSDSKPSPRITKKKSSCMKSNPLNVDSLPNFETPHIDDMEECSIEVNNNLQSIDINNGNNGSLVAMIINNLDPPNWLPNDDMNFVDHTQPGDSTLPMLDDTTFDIHELPSTKSMFDDCIYPSDIGWDGGWPLCQNNEEVQAPSNLFLDSMQQYGENPLMATQLHDPYNYQPLEALLMVDGWLLDQSNEEVQYANQNPTPFFANQVQYDSSYDHPFEVQPPSFMADDTNHIHVWNTIAQSSQHDIGETNDQFAINLENLILNQSQDEVTLLDNLAN